MRRWLQRFYAWLQGEIPPDEWLQVQADFIACVVGGIGALLLLALAAYMGRL